MIGMARLRATPLSCFHFFFHFSIFVLSSNNVSSFFDSNIHFIDSINIRVQLQLFPPSGAPWRCGVVTTQGGKAGIGVGHLLGREHASTPRSGVAAPRLFKTEPVHIGLLLMFLLLS